MPQIKIYTTPSCVYCKMSKEYFAKNNIQYQEIDVSSDQKAAEEMIEKSGQMGVPVIVITKDDGSEKVIVGFQKDQLAQELGLPS